MALSIGSLLAGRYEITAPIATGGMGEVWKARDRVLDRIVAAKVLKSEYTGDPSFLARFRNEARHTAALTHPNIASVYDYGETVDDTGTQQLAFLVMEFVEGQPLVTILHDEGALPVDWTLHVLSQSADGLSAAHRAGVVHRDIKPGNLMVRPDGVVKLTDFGIAQARDATPLTRTGMVVGTAQYLSPEQAQGMEVTAASDVYSLGVVAYECLTGARPVRRRLAGGHRARAHQPAAAAAARRTCPPAVRLLVERALAKDPADRFPDGGAFAEAIRRVAAGGTLAPAAARPAAATRRRPTPQVVGAAPAGGALAAGAPTGAAGRPRARSSRRPAPAAAAGPDRARRPDAAAAGAARGRRLGRRARRASPGRRRAKLAVAGRRASCCCSCSAAAPGCCSTTATAARDGDRRPARPPRRPAPAPTGVELDPAALRRAARRRGAGRARGAGLVVRREDADGDAAGERRAGRSTRATSRPSSPSSGSVPPRHRGHPVRRRGRPSTPSEEPRTTSRPPTTRADDRRPAHRRRPRADHDDVQQRADDDHVDAPRPTTPEDARDGRPSRPPTDRRSRRTARPGCWGGCGGWDRVTALPPRLPGIAVPSG